VTAGQSSDRSVQSQAPAWRTGFCFVRADERTGPRSAGIRVPQAAEARSEARSASQDIEQQRHSGSLAGRGSGGISQQLVE
jgi:hypothetical protein